MQFIPLERVHADPAQDRKTFNHDDLVTLARSIRTTGLLNPITVRTREDGQYVIVAGERRWRAHHAFAAEGMEALPTIAAIVRDDADHATAMLVENVVRADLNPIEEARAYAKRIADLGSDVAVAKATGIKVALIRKRVGLLMLRPELQELVGSGNLRRTYADEMVGLDANRQMIAMAALRNKPGMWEMDFRAVCAKLLAEQDQEQLFDPNSFTLTAEVYHARAAEVVESVTSDPPFAVIRLIAMCNELAEVCPDAELVARARALIAKAPRMAEAASSPSKQMSNPLPAGASVLDSLFA